jgi:carbonic anhydrase
MAVTVIDTDELIRRNATFADGRSFALVSDLNAKAVTHAVASVRVDVGVVKNGLPAGIFVSGLVYDVATGLVEAVVPHARVKP